MTATHATTAMISLRSVITMISELVRGVPGRRRRAPGAAERRAGPRAGHAAAALHLPVARRPLRHRVVERREPGVPVERGGEDTKHLRYRRPQQRRCLSRLEAQHVGEEVAQHALEVGARLQHRLERLADAQHRAALHLRVVEGAQPRRGERPVALEQLRALGAPRRGDGERVGVRRRRGLAPLRAQRRPRDHRAAAPRPPNGLESGLWMMMKPGTIPPPSGDNGGTAWASAPAGGAERGEDHAAGGVLLDQVAVSPPRLPDGGRGQMRGGASSTRPHCSQ
eukprot:gene1065-biopygen2209